MSRLAATLCLALAASPTTAQETGATLALHLDRVALGALARFPGLPEIDFGDPSAARRVMPAPPGTLPEPAVMRTAIAPLFDTLSPDLTAAWPRTVGVALTDVEAWTALAAPPERIALFSIAAHHHPTMTATLLAAGYVTADRPFPAVWRNPDDHAVDLAARDPYHPFGGNLGQASRVAFAGDIVLHSAGWPVIDAAMAGGPGLASRPDIAALILSLDSLPPGDHLLLAARLALDPRDYVTYPQIDLTALDPGRDLSEALVAADIAPALPLWSAALFADLSDGATNIAVVALAYPTRETAKSAAQDMARHWSQVPVPSLAATLAALAGAEMSVSVTGTGPFVALGTVTTPPGERAGRVVNTAHDLIYELYIRRELALVAPVP